MKTKSHSHTQFAQTCLLDHEGVGVDGGILPANDLAFTVSKASEVCMDLNHCETTKADNPFDEGASCHADFVS